MPPSPLPAPRDLSRHAGRRLRTFLLASLVIVDAAFSATAIDARAAFAAGVVRGPDAPLGNYAGVASIVGIALAVGVIWRRRYPVQLTVAGIIGGVGFQLGPTAALIGLMAVVRWRPRREWWLVGVPVAVLTVRRVWMDLGTQPAGSSFWGTVFDQLDGRVPWYLPTVLTVALLGAFGGTGLWLRTRSELASANEVVATEREQVTTLTDQVSRQAERERLAREIHDGLGHNLSILSVHAGALEAMAQSSRGAGADDPASAQLTESAQVVRETAARSVAELHGLLDLLRHPDDPDLAAPTRTLRDVRSLIDESVTAGMPLIATVYIDDGQAIDAHIAQAAYRIVQELLTNARKHAATVPVRLTVSGGPTDGSLVIATANHLPPGSAPPGAGRSRPDGTRAGTGLTGIRERVEHHGGDMVAGMDAQGVFRVSIRLPWAAPDPGSDVRSSS